MSVYLINPSHKIEACCSKDPDRANLTAPWADPKVGRVYATDGHMLASIPAPVDMDGCPEIPATAGHISPALLKQGRKEAKRAPTMGLSGDRSTLLGVTIKPADGGAFPDVSQVLPRFKVGDAGTTSVCFDVALLRRVCEAIDSETVILTFQPSTDPVPKGPDRIPGQPDGVILITKAKRDGPGDAFGLLMPLRATMPRG